MFHISRDVSLIMNRHQVPSRDKVPSSGRNHENPEISQHESVKDKPIDYRELYEQSKEREELIRQSLIMHEKLLDEVEDTISEVDLKGNITFVNKAASRVWGIAREQTIGLNYKSWSDPANQKIALEAYSRVYKTGQPCRFSYEIIRKDGVRRVVEDSGSAIRNAQGDIIGFRSVSRDITERKKVEKELAEHRSRLEAIFGSVKEAIITVDMTFAVMEANQSTETICGLKAREMVGKPLSECTTLCSQSCSDVIRQTLEKKSTIKEYRIECGHQQRQKQLVSVTSAPLRAASGQYLGAVLVIRDITLLRDLERELRERHQFQNIIGRSKKMQDVYRLLEDLANLETTVLITGESGTGKELVARALHYSGQRAFQPFIAVNCSALTESLLESELFGHVKGAFTGAIKDKQGRFQAANGGTLLLDEIGDISPIIQLKLLRVLQEKTFERVGDSEPQKVDVRVITCTNKNLREKVRLGEFREDLYYRLKVVEVALPPLRDRLEDLPLFIDHLCNIFNERFNRNIEGVSKEVLNIFMNYSWPGNVRELEHVIEHAFIICHDRVITLGDLPVEFREFRKHAAPGDSAGSPPPAIEAQEIIDALTKSHWNKTKAAHLLGINRRTLYRKLEQFHIDPDV
jgi:two-component system, NtrC family, response regulator HydG